MTLAMDFSADYVLWDLAEAVTFTASATAGNTNVSVATALRAQPEERERAPSGGVYAGFDLTWYLPGPLLSGHSPKPGDLVTDGSSVPYTVLKTNYDQLDKVWVLYTVDLILANDLRDTVDIYGPTDGQDAGGARVPSFAPVYSSLAARVQEVQGEVATERGKHGTRQRFDVFLTTRVSVTIHHQVRKGATIYSVTGWRNPDRIDELMVLNCERVPA